MFTLQNTKKITVCLLFCWAFATIATFAQTSEFTYQGRLNDGGAPANGTYDLSFSLYDAETESTSIGNRVVPNVPVTDGVYSVRLNFGALAFTGADRWLEISFRPAGGTEWALLIPRQKILSVPYSIRSLEAGVADSATNLSGVPAEQFVQTTDGRLSDARPPLPGSANYIQNTILQQAGASFNISGTGVANSFNALTQYNLGNSRIIGVKGDSGLFVGFQAGSANTTGVNNSFFGNAAGFSNTTGTDNSFFGYGAGYSNTTGGENSFFGGFSGYSNTTGDHNSFFGKSAGHANTTGGSNSFFGFWAGHSNTTGFQNSFFGYFAGLGNTSGSRNTFVGYEAGGSTTGNYNTAVGFAATVGNNLSFATAIGAGAVVSTSTTIVLGRSQGQDNVLIPGNLKVETLGSGGAIQVCLNNAKQLSNCSSSLRYKTNIASYNSGLNIIRRLRPITFNWKDGGLFDLGLGAEEVAEIEPLLVTYNARGEVEGVKYDRVGVVLINAVNEQQEQIEQRNTRLAKQRQLLEGQQTQINEQQRQIENLKKLVCPGQRGADICK